MFGWLKKAPAIPRLPEHMIAKMYRIFRMRTIIGIFIGYAGYYLVRSNFTLSTPYLKSEFGFSPSQIGMLSAALAVTYGISKFFMGNLADKAHTQRFIAVGLFLSAVVNLILGSTSSFGLIFMMLVVNGVFQGMGAPPCSIVLANWFSKKERGTYMGIWNTSHNIGGGIIAPIIGVALGILGSAYWQTGIFVVPSIMAMIIAVFVWFCGKDTPQSVGLPPIDEYRNDYDDVERNPDGDKLSMKEILIKYVLKNKFIWYLCLANVFVYFIRFGVLNWVPLYLTEEKGFTQSQYHIAFAVFEWAAILSSLVVGVLSDKLFKGNRMPLCIISMIGVVLATLVYWQSSSVLVITIAVSIIGCLIYVPQFLIGLSAIDFVPKFAVGTTVGLTGLFAYLFGNLTASALVGFIVESSGWNGCFLLLLLSGVLATLFLTMIQVGRKKKLANAANQA
ncbi:MFS transporter [Paenibacillus popilliae]|uniref:Sugar phosphate permease n=1 Tax=Paenibacillus popilliae ATCC 14706 TaxID=1212764 RepID=M9LQ14_PAEPP|nr:MFS transporter [Paenibacillus popilliae]GAC42716.1 sugar phosphate permease [Paenibacillus popilliae ATCC 14706]